MSIFAAPSFYNQVDQNIFAGGDRFIPQEQYRLGLPIQKNISFDSGITNTAAANMVPPLPIIPRQGGEGGGGITTVGPTTGAFDYEFDALGNVPNPDNVGLTDDEQDALDSFSNPGLNAIDVGTIGGMALGFTNPITGILGLVFNQRRKQKQAEAAAAEAAAAAETARQAAANRAAGNRGGYQSNFAKDRDFMEGPKGAGRGNNPGDKGGSDSMGST